MKVLWTTAACLTICSLGRAATQQEVDAAIDRLGATQFAVRQQATNYLWGIGRPAAEALRRAASSADPEVRLRARSILERYDFGIFVETPHHEVQLINRFRHGSELDRRKAYQQLAKEGSIGTLLVLLQRVSEPELRSEFRELVLTRLERDRAYDRLLELAGRWRHDEAADGHLQKIRAIMRRQVPRLLALARTEEAEEILRQAATDDAGQRDWAVYLFLQGRLNETLSAAAPSEPGRAELERTVYQQRVQGKLAEARQAALRLGEGPVFRGALFEYRDWTALAEAQKELLKRDPYGAGQNIEALGYAAAFYRLAGRKDDLGSVVAQIKSLAQRQSTAEWNCAEALLINHHVDDAIDILKSRFGAIAFEMLCIQERYDKAFQLAGINDPHADNRDWFDRVAAKASKRTVTVNREFELAVQVARALYRLGEKRQALDAFETLSRAVQAERGGSRLHQICKAEFQVGLTEQARQHAAVILDRGKYPDPLPTLFPRHRDLARVWWDYFTDVRLRKGAQALARMDQLIRPDAQVLDPAEFSELIESAERHAATLPNRDRTRWMMALAQTCEINGRHDLARAQLSSISEISAEASLKLGDIAAAADDWSTAAEHYRAARDLDADSALSRYLHGHALEKIGMPAEAAQERQLAVLLPLADSNARRQLASGLRERGFRDEAIEQWKLVLRCGAYLVSLKNNFRDTSLIDAAQNVGNSLLYDPEGRARHWEVMHLSCLEKLLWIPNYRGYFHTPHIVHKTRAQAHLDVGEIDAALRQIELSRSFMPGNIELAEHLVPRLEEAGATQAAEDVFTKSYDFVKTICNQFPDSPLHHNNLAWLCARCDRRLDDALEHVQRALELAPDTPSYLDTLGEVHFRRGAYEDAIACARRCIELEPNSRFFHQQLERFQKRTAETEESAE